MDQTSFYPRLAGRRRDILERLSSTRMACWWMLFFFLGMVGAEGPAAHAETVFWKAREGSWHESVWWEDELPSSDDYAIIDNGGTVHISSDAKVLALVAGKKQSGAIVHSAGQLEGTGLYLANENGSATYTLAGGSLLLKSGRIGLNGKATFIQTGGKTVLRGSNYSDLQLGVNAGSVGRYLLKNASMLQTGSEEIGFSGKGIFEQHGGTHVVIGSAAQGCLSLGSNPSGDGEYHLFEGVLDTHWTNVGSWGSGFFLQYGGSHHVDELYLGRRGEKGVGTYFLFGGVLDCDFMDIKRGYFEIKSAASKIYIRDNLVLRDEGIWRAVTGAGVWLDSADFDIESTKGANLTGLMRTTFRVRGGSEAAALEYEIASRDAGPSHAAFSMTNFGIGSIRLGESSEKTYLMLIDDFDNSPGSDVLYVKDLYIGPQATLDLNGKIVYYQSMVNHGRIQYNGGALKKVQKL